MIEFQQLLASCVLLIRVSLGLPPLRLGNFTTPSAPAVSAAAQNVAVSPCHSHFQEMSRWLSPARIRDSWPPADSCCTAVHTKSAPGQLPGPCCNICRSPIAPQNESRSLLLIPDIAGIFPRSRAAESDNMDRLPPADTRKQCWSWDALAPSDA